MKEQTDFFIVSELVEMFQRSQVTINTWIAKGHFPNAKKAGPSITSEWRIPKGDVEAFKKEHRVYSVST